MIYDQTYNMANHYPTYFDPYIHQTHLHPFETSYNPLNIQNSRERYEREVTKIRRKPKLKGNSNSYYDLHCYNDLNPYICYEENGEESEDGTLSYSRYYNDQYCTDMTRLASALTPIGKDRTAHQSARLYYKSKDNEVAWPQSAVYVNEPMMLLDPVTGQHQFQQLQQQILGTCTTDHMPSRLLSPAQITVTAAPSSLGKPSNDSRPLPHLPNIPVLQQQYSLHHAHNQPYLFNIASDQPAAPFHAFPQPFFNSASPLDLVQQPFFHPLSLNQTFFPSGTTILNSMQAYVDPKEGGSVAELNHCSNEHEPTESSASAETSVSSPLDPSSNMTSAPVTAITTQRIIPKRRRSMMENILSSFHLLQEEPDYLSSDHVIHGNQNGKGSSSRSREQQLPAPIIATHVSNTTHMEGTSSESTNGSHDVTKSTTVSPTYSAIDDSGLSRLSRRTSLKLFRKASALRRRQYLWCYKPQQQQQQQQNKEPEQMVNPRATTTVFPASASWIAFDVKNQLKLDKQFALISSKMAAHVNAQQQQEERQGSDQQDQQQKATADDILTLYKQSQVDGPMLVSLQRGVAWSFNGTSNERGASDAHSVTMYEIACIPCHDSKFVVSDQLLNEEKQKKTNTLKRSKSLDGLAAKLLTTILKH